jgi:hypothetical protein
MVGQGHSQPEIDKILHKPTNSQQGYLLLEKPSQRELAKVYSGQSSRRISKITRIN